VESLELENQKLKEKLKFMEMPNPKSEEIMKKTGKKRVVKVKPNAKKKTVKK
jgi:regulator of replication initiation timing